MEDKFVKFDFTERDILDSFECYVESGRTKKKDYYFKEIVFEFADYMEDDIIKAYGKENLYKCKKFITNYFLIWTTFVRNIKKGSDMFWHLFIYYYYLWV